MGIRLNVYRSAHLGDCTNGGVTADHDVVVVVNVDGPFNPSDTEPAVVLRHGHVIHTARLVPAQPDGDGGWQELAVGPGVVGPMFGGNYAGTSDGRFGRAVAALGGNEYGGVVAVHDRYERSGR